MIDAKTCDIINRQLVGVSADGLLVVRPQLRMTSEKALVHAAWLVALAEEQEGQFQEILNRVKNT